MRQYFFESEKDGMPFSRDTRRWSISVRKWCSTSGRSHPGEHLRRRLRMDASFDWAEAECSGKIRIHIAGRDCANALFGHRYSTSNDASIRSLRRRVSWVPNGRLSSTIFAR